MSQTFLPSHLASLLQPGGPTVTAAYAKSPADAIHQVAEGIFGKSSGAHTKHVEEHEGSKAEGGTVDKLLGKLHLKSDKDSEGQTEQQQQQQQQQQQHHHDHNPAQKQYDAIRPLAPAQLDEVKRYGRWGTAQPSETFLQIFAQTLLPLADKPLKGVVSPALVGSTGVVPLSIISVIPDIIEHHADIIVRAEHEIFLATNFWEASGAAKVITDAVKELSRRVTQANRPKVVMKLMYDRGNPSQVIDPHQLVDEKTYTGDKVKLPHPHEIPGVQLEVLNYHEPPVGTFHSKYMVVDRKIAILNSNNIQDRVNVEMMLHIEGPIVQSFYDLCLVSWAKSMNPPLPLVANPPTYREGLSQQDFLFGTGHPNISSKGDIATQSDNARKTLAQHHADTEEHGDPTESDQAEKWDSSNADEANRVDSQLQSAQSINQHLNTGTKIKSNDDSPPPNAHAFKPVVLHSPHDPVPMALVNRPPRGRPGHGDTFVPQDQAFLSGFKFAKKHVFIQTPTFNAVPVVQAALDAVRRGILVEIYADLGFNDEGELLPFQGGTNEMVAGHMYSELTEEQKPNLRIFWYTGKDQRTPLNAKDKSRNCHVKLMIIDESVIIQGNGNQDTQSWFHSQEVNVMIDSPLLAGEIREAIDANQNTMYYGLVDPKDGVWRDQNGKELPGQKKPPKGPLKSLVGVKGAIQRVRGEGGF